MHDINTKIDLTVCIRFHDISQIARLDMCLFSISANSVRPNLIILTQNFSRAEHDEVDNTASRYEFENCKIINISSPEKDLRTILLNIGLKHCKTKAIHFLDYDDCVLENCYRSIQRALVLDQYRSNIYFFSVLRSFNNVYDNHDYVTCIDRPWKSIGIHHLLTDNFFPLHSYVINVENIRELGLQFDESFTVLEDYAFLLNAARYNKFNFENFDICIGIYNFRNDGSNTTIHDTNEFNHIKKSNQWDSGRQKVSLLKKLLSINIGKVGSGI